ncbi:tRNA (adenosine(37)-N6)-threonylcarbamoyltransferase complex transferase subunit TsaD [Candidatus Woesearchaeota archaeon]|nr:tRNA (adenosine(37)-N6)-threonylcarbamoyltransferase complex transferase subunit TsaD [Candidatus Woesearchaeota archaeon]
MNCIGIESTAHTFSCSVVNDKGEILSEEREMYKSPDMGIIPNKCAEFLKNVKDKLIKKVITESGVKKFELIAFSQGPGMPLSLWVGANAAKEQAIIFNSPLIGVSHLIAHLEIGKLMCKAKDPVYILATGANTQIIAFEGEKYRIFGECLTIGIGNALDKFGREIGLGFPAGPKIEEFAKKGKYIELPYVVKGMDVEFSGIITKAIRLYKKGAKKEDLCFSLQETMFSMLTEVAERALAHTDKNELLLIGGVAANKRLIEMLETMCKERNAKFEVVPFKWSGDNAAMIAWTGILNYKKNKKSLELKKIEINPKWRIDA